MVDMPDLPPLYAQVMVVQADAPKQGAAKTDHTIGVCHLIQNPPTPPGTAVNVISPLGSVSVYLQSRERRALDWKSSKVSVLQGPEHGELRVTSSGKYRYFPAADYYGLDRATLLVEIGGLTVNAVYFFNVLHTVGGTEGYDPYDDKKYCPKGEMWKISLNRDAPNGGLISYQHLK